MSRPETDLLDSLSAELSQQLKDRVDRALLEFIRPNYESQFAQAAPELVKFRKAIAQGDLKDDLEFLRSFREFVPTTNYEPYRPFIAKFFATPCKENDVKNMFAPGLPYFLAMSSMTSGKPAKIFPKYRPPPYLLHHPLYLALPPSEGITLSPASLKYSQILQIDGEDGQSKQVTVCSLSIGFLRMAMNWDAERDNERLDLWLPGQTDPYAISLVKSYRAFFVLNSLFALADRRYVEDEWPLLIDCIEKGIIPDVENLDHLRAPLEKLFKLNPLRAAELREIGLPGIEVRWDHRRSCYCLRSKINHALGPSVPTQSPGYGSSEGGVAITYHEGDPKTDFKVVFVDVITEFLDVRSNEPSERVLSTWELAPGGHYEPVLTTRNGLWRYRLGDVVIVKGFAPDDGLPVISYLHRREGGFVMAFGTTCTESQLTNAIVSAADRCIGQIIDFTIVGDDRDTPITYGYLIEIGGAIGKDARMAMQQTFEDLMAANDEFRTAFWQGRARKPTIRLLEKGTFGEYRRHKCDKTNISISQVKVPVVLSDLKFREWFLERVMLEL
ncbi:GH3 auxin-responsive promoter-domain-containing protein [Suillus subaureus]|uniref:GH3 auxin-responsive promoter-domain-containing protein n=1 Tax=Suillus subaureus TaxID=48587 RepID=A0A9P7E9A3_9AGAM|nr:GH3 auxin-responsive promoter-domain-containing protein [Suillus subaureus]KAG1815029.1 GH3 auxin-responsive promoter-domain-containing protein [Suillus subaureus]